MAAISQEPLKPEAPLGAAVCRSESGIQHARRVLRSYLGWPSDGDLSEDPAITRCASLLLPRLTADDEAPAGEGETGDWWKELAALDSDSVNGRTNPAPRMCLERWPSGAPFALFLSHDIDQIHDRELFRILGDINHVRRRLLRGENGNTPLACARILRALLRPKRPLVDFETITRMEGRHGFRSTFFVLHDRYLARQGSRFAVDGQAMREIGRLILSAGSELGVHGGYYRFNDAEKYRASAQAIEDIFGVRPTGIRNHLLRFSYPETWRAQAAAGLAYDATYGRPRCLGARSGLPVPFFAYDDPGQRALDLLELPLTVMDTTLFRYLGLSGEAALATAWRAVEQVVAVGGLVTLLWHNNFFNEPEYWDWHMVYEKLLERLAVLQPWCATGAEINRWWRARAALRWGDPEPDGAGWRWVLESPQAIEGLVLRVEMAQGLSTIEVEHPAATVHRQGEGWRIQVPKLEAGTRFSVRASR